MREERNDKRSWRRFNTYDCPESPVMRVPQEEESIASAVEKAGDTGRVVVAAGSYRENIRIPPGARITICAETSQRPKLIPADPELPVIHVSPGAALCLIGMAVHGEKSGVVFGSPTRGEPALAVIILDSYIADAEYGIYGLAEDFRIDSSAVEGNGYGLSVAGTVSLTDTTITANTMGAVLSGTNTPSCAGASYIDNQNNVSIQKVNVSNNKKGGIAICNAASASVVDAYVHKNTAFGVLISSTPGFSLLNVRVGETRAWQGKWGDGLIVVHSSGLLKDSQFSANKRANIIYYGQSGGTLDNNLIIYAVFSIVLDGKDGSSPNPIIKKSNYMYGNRVNRVTFGSNLVPAPLPQIPTL